MNFFLIVCCNTPKPNQQAILLHLEFPPWIIEESLYINARKIFKQENNYFFYLIILLSTWGLTPPKTELLENFASFYIHHHHLVVPSARISLTLSRYLSLSFIASGRSSGLHPVSSQSCCMLVQAGRPAFARPWEGVHWSTSLISSSLHIQQGPVCLVRLTWLVFVIGGKWPYTCCFVGRCFRDTKMLRTILNRFYIQ